MLSESYSQPMPGQLPICVPDSQDPESEPVIESTLPLETLLPGLLENYNQACEDLSRHNKQGLSLKEQKEEYLSAMHQLMKKRDCKAIDVGGHTLSQSVTERKGQITEATVTRVLVDELGSQRGMQLVQMILGSRVVSTKDTLSIRKTAKRKEM